MAPKVVRIQCLCETGKGISIMCRLLNSLHRPQAGLHTELFFEDGKIFCFSTSMALRSSRATLIALADSTCGYKAIFSCTDIHESRLPHNFCFHDHFIIIGVCLGINYHDLVGFRINIKDFGKTCEKRLYDGGKDYRGFF
ncbi:DNA-directed RNA polymerases II, IV and V subunit 3-like [Pyrus ussuriensis x Pyrus communis]|uniref:DNA-directed RNA polymerases II, IV and V subunit 3-like n=1 Tax=Pyrus ussuriensis x Pyrus communis TaxID=2448454 RepID=A0A5N5G6C2_9ROSA|nr:DNA-directed RNA polymerases II, IV and V subunit 3-like [Pyrus ussuriensis x Pyrus communis]